MNWLALLLGGAKAGAGQAAATAAAPAAASGGNWLATLLGGYQAGAPAAAGEAQAGHGKADVLGKILGGMGGGGGQEQQETPAPNPLEGLQPMRSPGLHRRRRGMF